MAAEGMSRDVLLKIISQFDSKGVDEATKATLSLGKLGSGGLLGGLVNAFKGMASNVLGILNPLNLVQGALGALGNGVTQLGGIFKIGLGVVAGQAIQTLLGTFRQLIASPVELAARVETLEIVFNRIGQAAGYSKEALAGLVDGLKKTGITTQESLSNLTQMIQANLDLSKATQLARVAQDAAVIAGTNSSDAFQRLLSGIITLQPEILRGLGIIVDMQAEVKKYAEAHGVAAESISATMKQQIAFDAVLSAAANISGSYTAAMETVGKKMGSLKRYVEEAQLALGRGLTPILSAAVDIATDVAKNAQVAFEALRPVLTSFSESVGRGLATLYEKAKAAVGFLVEGFNYARPYLQEIADIMGNYLPQVSARLSALWNELKNALMGLASTAATYLPNMAGLWTFFTDSVKVAFESVLSIIDGFTALLQGKGGEAAASFSDAVANGLAILIIVWEDYVSKALVWGYNLVAQFAQGMIDAGGSWIASAVEYVGGLIAQFLASFSPPRRGVLSGILEWGKGLINTYFQGFTQADFGILDQVGGLIKNALQSAVSLGDLPEEQMIPLFQKVKEQVAGLISTFRQTGQIGEEALGKIGETLGAGSEDLVKYLRLQLEHQKALKDLAGVQDEYAKAEAAGFVPAELKAKLKAAQDAAQAKEDELNWQAALVKAQQDGVDLQVQQIQVMKQLAAAMEKVSGALGGAGKEAKAPKVEGMKAPAVGAMTPLAIPLADTSQLQGSLQAGINKALGMVSERFEEAKAKAKELMANFLNGAQEGLGDLPRIIKEGIGQAIANLRENYPIIDTLITKLEKLGGVIGDVIGSAVDVLVGTTWPKLQEAFATLTDTMSELGISWSDVWNALLRAVVLVATGIGYAIVGLVGVVVGALNGIATAILWSQTAWNFLAESVKGTIEGIARIFGGFAEIVKGILAGDFTQAINGAGQVIAGLAQTVMGNINIIIGIFGLMVSTVTGFVWGLVEGIVGFFTDLYNRLVGGSLVPELINAVIAAFQFLYQQIVAKVLAIKDEVLAKFRELRDQATAIITQMRDWVKEKIEAIKGFFDDLKSKIGEVLEKIQDLANLSDIFENFKDNIGEAIGKIGEFVKSLTEAVIPDWPFKLQDAFGWIADKVKAAYDWLSQLLATLADAVLPEWLTPGSPTPFELGLRGITEAMADLSAMTDQWAASLNVNAPRPLATAGGGSPIYLFVDSFNFPSIRSGRDVDGFMAELQSQVDTATARANVPGGAR